jgi:hypothetical protein
MRNQPLIFWKPQTRRDFLRQAAGAGLFLAGSAVLHPLVHGSRLAHASSSLYVYEGSESAHITFTTDPKRIQTTVPEPFQVNDKGIMTAWFAYERKVKPKMAAHEYVKAVLAIPVEYKGKGVPMKGLFIEKAYVNDPFSVYAAAEAYGYPAHYANIDWSANQASIKSTVKKKDGTRVAHMTLSLSNTKAATQPWNDVIHFNAQGTAPSLKLSMTEIHEEELERVPGEVVGADLFGIEINQVIEAVYRKYDWSGPMQSEALAE